MTTTRSERPLVGVGVAAVESGKLLMIQRGNEPGKGLWAVPGGKVEFGETMRDAARREVAEETGLVIEVGDVIWVGESLVADHHIVLIDFTAKVVGGVLSAGDDAADARWVPLDQLDEYPLTATMYDLVDTLRA